MLKIKVLSLDARLPSRGSEEAAGLDLYAPASYVVLPGELMLLRAGYAIELPPGYVAFIRPRSSMYARGIDADGTIDSDYRGELKIALRNVGNSAVEISAGDRVAQLVVQRHSTADYTVVDRLSTTARSNGGFGSTGK